jgi:hypothetical protein
MASYSVICPHVRGACILASNMDAVDHPRVLHAYGESVVPLS